MSPGAPRRFPPPRRAERIAGGYVVRDANEQSIAYIYAREKKPRRCKRGFSLLTRRGASRPTSPGCRSCS
jgi:hypothetical protein